MIVTISNQHGSGAVSVAQNAARALGYTLVDRQLPVVVAKRLRISAQESRSVDETGRSLGARFLSGLELSTPEVAGASATPTFDDAYIVEVQKAVRDYAARGNVVIVGRAAGVILGRRRDVLRVFMHAPREWRIERMSVDLEIDARVAAAEVDRVDKARAAHLRDWYGAAFGDSGLYDLSIDTSSFGIEASAEIIAGAVRTHS
ncbi:MAG TPA: cytidylate kinase-like family protein [Candidatus Baltobacteraceae bacterium]|nr:cytidylate kinase-like family protein [Candidatus Baltobacteraceae bacterium]